jgi:hypothetical protein
MATSIPTGQHHQFVDIQLLELMVATECIVDAQRAVFEIVFKSLCPRVYYSQQQESEYDKSFHRS